MSLSSPIALAIIACTLALGLTGCADNRLNAGYIETASRLQPPVTRQIASAQAPALDNENADTKVASTQPTYSPYVYRGGRDPVTGQAFIRN